LKALSIIGLILLTILSIVLAAVVFVIICWLGSTIFTTFGLGGALFGAAAIIGGGYLYGKAQD